MTINEKQFEFTYLLGKLIVRVREELNLDISLREVWRSVDRQKEMVERGLSKTYRSKHIDSLAADFVLFRNGKPVWDTSDDAWKKFGSIVKSFGLVWGGDWGWDFGHVQYKDSGDS